MHPCAVLIVMSFGISIAVYSSGSESFFVSLMRTERIPLEVPAPIARFEACELRLDLWRVGVKNRVVALIRDWTLGVWTAENRCIEFRRGWNVGARIEDDLEHILAELAKRT